MDKYLIVIDLDGTTVTRENKVHEKTKTVIKKLNEIGHMVVIATGRSVRSSLSIYNELELDSFIIIRNGAYVFSPKRNEVLNIIRIPKASLIEIFQGKITEYLSEIYIDCNDQFYCFKGNKNETITYDEIKSMITCTLIIPDEHLSKVIDYLKSKNEVKYDYWNIRDKRYLLEIYPKMADKGDALIYIKDYYHILDQNIITIGDQTNDIKMIKNAGLGVAVKNASEKLKEHADLVLDYTNDEGAVGIFLNDFFKLSILNT